MPRRKVYRNGRVSYRADGRVEYTGDDGQCPNCGCFACACSNNFLYQLEVDDPFVPPCRSQSAVFTNPGGERPLLHFCVPRQIGLALDLPSPPRTAFTANGGYACAVEPFSIDVGFCLSAIGASWYLAEVRPENFVGYYRWMSRVTLEFGTTYTETKCCRGVAEVWVGASRDVDSDSGVSLFAIAYLDVGNYYAQGGGIDFRFCLAVVYYKEVPLDPDDSDNPFCKSGSSEIDLGISDSLPAWVGMYSFVPWVDCTSGGAKIRVCLNCDYQALAGGCGNVPPQPQKKHCWYLFEANKTGGSDVSPTWSDWSFVDSPGSVVVSIDPPSSISGPIIYRSGGGACKARLWVDGGIVPDSGECSETPPAPPATLTGSTKCPPQDAVGNCTGCTDNKCDRYSYRASYPEGGSCADVTYSGPFLEESNIDCPADGQCQGTWMPDTVADRTSVKSFYVCHNAAAPAMTGGLSSCPEDFSA